MVWIIQLQPHCSAFPGLGLSPSRGCRCSESSEYLPFFPKLIKCTCSPMRVFHKVFLLQMRRRVKRPLFSLLGVLNKRRASMTCCVTWERAFSTEAMPAPRGWEKILATTVICGLPKGHSIWKRYTIYYCIKISWERGAIRKKIV